MTVPGMYVDETVPQLVRRIKMHTDGVTYIPRFGETVLKVVVEADNVTIKLDKVSYQDLPQGGWEAVNHGVKLVSIVKTDQSSWKTDSFVFWDDDFMPYEVATPINRKRLASEYKAQKEWEDSAYRWGNGSRFGGRDSADRQFQGYDYSNPTFYTTETGRE